MHWLYYYALDYITGSNYETGLHHDNTIDK